MTDAEQVARLAADLVRIDSRSALPNLVISERIEAELAGFAIERLDYADSAGVTKRVLVARRGGPGGIALSGHMDTVPGTGWRNDPWTPRVDEAGVLHGLGSVDMKGAVAAAIIAARGMPGDVPATLLITTDEETTKQGARVIAERSELARGLTGIVVCEPTQLAPIRGHRSHIEFTAIATGMQAHSSLGLGDNANWKLLPFLAEMRELFAMLRDDTRWHDADYAPPFSDFNLILDNHGTAINVTVGRATARIKFRHTAKQDPAEIVARVAQAAQRAGLALHVAREGAPPELPATHPLVARAAAITGKPPGTAPYGTDASELQPIAPCVICGPGSVASAHTPDEQVSLADLAAAVPVFRALLRG